jgi:hypothetical protein
VLWATKRHVAPFIFAVLFVYLGLTFASHLLFNAQDAAGWVCRERRVVYQSDARHPNRVSVKVPKELVNLELGQTYRLPEFRTKELCQSTGVWVERNGRYRITFDSTDNFRDGKIDGIDGSGIDGSEGFYSTDPTIIFPAAAADGSQGSYSTHPSALRQYLTAIGQPLALMAGVPLRRELIRPWFRIVTRIGGKGSEENFLDPDFSDKPLINETIRAPRDGELFLFVNDAVIGIPGLYDLFYKNNEGATGVTIKRLGASE